MICALGFTQRYSIHYSKFHSIDRARVWVVRMKNLTLDKLYYIRTRDTQIKYFLNGLIYDSNKFRGCLHLSQETSMQEVKWLLSSWNTQDVSLSAAGINHYKAGELIPVVNRPDSYIVAIGHFRPSPLVKKYCIKVSES